MMLVEPDQVHLLLYSAGAVQSLYLGWHEGSLFVCEERE